MKLLTISIYFLLHDLRNERMSRMF